MQATSHRVFNATLAADVIIKFHQSYLCESFIIAAGLFLFSSFPDTVEKFKLKHRGISHSVILYVMLTLTVSCCLYFCPRLYWEWFIIYGMLAGCLGHIFADAFSKNGIKALGYPIRFRAYSTGKRSEQLFLWLFVIINFFIIFVCLKH